MSREFEQTAAAAEPDPADDTSGRAPPELAGIVALQRSAGNAAVAGLVQGRAGGPVVQRTWLNPFHTAPVDDPSLSDEEKIAQTARSSGNDVVQMYRNAPHLFGRASESQRIAMLNLLNGEAWVGSEAEYAMEAIWNSFGSEVAAVADRHQQLWRACIDRGAELHTISAVTDLRAAFERDVKGVADDYMASNLAAARTESQALGLSQPPAGEASPTRELEVGLRRREVADLMDRVSRTQAAQAAMRQLPVGYGAIIDDYAEPTPGSPGVREEETADSEGHVTGMRRVRREIAHFVPGEPPRIPPGAEERALFRSHAEVQQQWDLAQRYIDVTASQSPAVFAAVEQRRVGEAATAPTPERALQVVGEVLGRLEANIRQTRESVATGDIDYRSLRPIHEQLYRGQVLTPSGTRWNGAAARAVGEGVVADHEAAEMWRSLVVGLLAGGAFVAAEIFSGGLATPLLIGVGVGLGLGQVGVSWENYVDLATAAGSATSADTRVVSPEQAEEALFQLVMDSVFVFLDAASPAWRGLQAVRSARGIAAAMERTAVRQAGRVGELIAAGNTDEAARIVRALVNEGGVQRALDQTGRSAEDLARLFPADVEAARPMRDRLLGASRFGIGAPAAAEGATEAAAADAARRSARAALAGDNAAARAFMESGSLEHLISQVVVKLNDDVITPQMADQLILEAVERLGPRRTIDLAGGWQRLSTALTNESRAAAPFIAWRRGIFDDLRTFAERSLHEPIPDQGSSGAFKNDLDVSFMGEHGAADRARARAFIAARAGIEDSNEALNRHLMMELFTDPRRLRAYDALPDAMRERLAREQTAYERELIPNRDLHAARHHGDTVLEEAILDQMRRDGVREIAYRPLSAGEVERLAHDLDRAHAELLAAVRAEDTAAQEVAARRLGQTQALMNAAEEGGYFSGGSARRYVTDRRDNPSMRRLVPGRGETPLSTDDIGAMIDQLSKLNHAAAELTQAVRVTRQRIDIVTALRAIGKYGERAAEVAGGSGAPAGWEGFTAACVALKQAADRQLGMTLLRESPELTVATARRLLGEVRERSMEALSRIRPATSQLGPGNAEAVNRAIRDHVFMLRLEDNINHLVAGWARAVRTGTEMRYDELMEAPRPDVSAPGDFGDPAEGQRLPGARDAPPATATA